MDDESSRAAALHYWLWSANEDRKVLEMNLAGERASARTWEGIVQALRAEVDELKARLAKVRAGAGRHRLIAGWPPPPEAMRSQSAGRTDSGPGRHPPAPAQRRSRLMPHRSPSSI